MSESSVATIAMLRQWFNEAPPGTSHMIVAVDEFDWSNYPIYVAEGQDIRKQHEIEKQKPMQRVMEIYRRDYSFEKQVQAHRCFVYELPPDGYDDHVLDAVRAIAPSSLNQGRLTREEMLVLCRTEIARRRAANDRAKEKAASERYMERKRQDRVERLDAQIASDREERLPVATVADPNRTYPHRRERPPQTEEERARSIAVTEEMLRESAENNGAGDR